MKKKTGILSKIYIAILLIFLYSPIAVLIFYSCLLYTSDAADD